ncbi:CPBP family intramembrane metalloprotease [Halovulum dunhuangense]|uniref:CPBP family intramembrane metalloprotease n=1 Tax=Halovulum dunhuangense TaxID=1505036 RepID=A0A849L1I5_9RHOB|nr:CPBP family intramembrane glutamic endopeptidase [Halovulum dunhuangense]NNU80099.1 CPBP family intramembrane metalloprotease [Halovulum dunhuangense]
MAEARRGAGSDLPSWAVVPFLGLTFLVTWALIGAYVVAPGTATAWLGPLHGGHPVFFVATWSPALAALALVLGLRGVAGLRAFVLRLFLWRCPWGWVAFTAIGLPLVFVAGSALKGGPPLAPLPPEGAGPMLGLLAMMLFLGPVEEFGWRGLAQPILQRHMAPALAGALVGAVWGLWHLPVFYLAGMVFAEWDFLPFLVGNVALAVLVTPILNRTGGSLMWPMLFHWQLINPFWPDAQPWDSWILAGVAGIVLWWNRAAMFGRAGAVTQVLPPARGVAGVMPERETLR